MNQRSKVQINKLSSGVPGLDDILGGGFPEFSFNIIAGAPGSGKTTLAHQFVFANATEERPALYFTVLGEPALKMLRYQQQYTFFDVTKLNSAIRFINLSQDLIEGGLQSVLAEITKQVQATNAGIVVVDSFRTVLRREHHGDREVEVQTFVQKLALLLTSWEATTFLIGEYAEAELQDNPVFTVADGLFWLYQQVERNSVVRKLQVMKLRGQMSVPGMHTFRITNAGLQAFSRTLGLTGRKKNASDRKRLSTGIADLDAGRASSFGLDLDTSLNDGSLEIIYLRPLDLSVDEMMQELIDAVQRTGAKRLVLDSLAGFEMALAPGFRTDFRESLYRMIFALTGIGITILSTLEMEEEFDKLLFSSYSISFLTDDIIRFRYVEIDGQLRKIMMVLKMRGGPHSNDIREYKIASHGIVIGERLKDYEHLITGLPDRIDPVSDEDPGDRSK
jgi:circadian clock protein KaiC